MAQKVKSRRSQEDVAEQPLWQRPVVIGVLLAGLLLAAVLIVVANSQRGGSAGTAAGVSPDGRALGPTDAPVTIVEYGDYACPHCRNFHIETVSQLEETYIADGTVRFEMQPVAYLGNPSLFAANAALCAQDQDQFWPYHDRLFQALGEFGNTAFDTSRLKEYAAELGLDQEQFNQCVDGNQHVDSVRDITNEAQSRGVTGTPTIFINGEKVEGERSFSQLEQRYIQPNVQ